MTDVLRKHARTIARAEEYPYRYYDDGAELDEAVRDLAAEVRRLRAAASPEENR